MLGAALIRPLAFVVLSGLVGCSGSTTSDEGTRSAGGADAGLAGGGGSGGSQTLTGGRAQTEGGGSSGSVSAGGATNEGGSAHAGTNQSGGSSNLGEPDCKVAFTTLERACSSDADCVLVAHQINCCGGIRLIGLPLGQKPAFEPVEQYCAAQFPPCGCAAFQTELEDGTTIDVGATNAVAACVMGACQSRKATTSFACGSVQCSADQYCEELLGGVPGSQPSYGCRPLGDCHDCSCVKAGGCQCTKNTDGTIKLLCAAP